MLAYRHAFHAGNHADVLKHLVLIQVLRHMGRKDKPYRLVDTHAGGGAYRLDSEQAQKKGEYREGVARLWPLAQAEGAVLPEAVRDYLDALLAFNGPGELLNYPGSPQLALAQRRAQDQLRFYELHPSEFRILGEQLGAPDALPAGVQLAQLDGFAALKSQLPPPSRRAVVLLDPSYELASDYERLVDALRDALKRFAEGVYVVWYPQVSRVEASQLPRRLKALAPRGWLHARLSVQQPDAQGFGLMGSGMFVFNPPYTLHDSLAQALPWLVERLAQHAGASQLLEQHAV